MEFQMEYICLISMLKIVRHNPIKKITNCIRDAEEFNIEK